MVPKKYASVNVWQHLKHFATNCGNFIAKKKIQDKNHIYLKEYCRFYNIMVWCLFEDGAHLYFGEEQAKNFNLVYLYNKGLLIECEIY